MRRLPLLAAALLAVTLAAPRPARAQDEGIRIGTPAPPAVVYAMDGKPVNLAQWIGKGPVLLEFWATWCENCKALEPTMAAVARKYAGKAQFVGVAVAVNQSEERAHRYADAHHLPLTIVYDRTGAASSAYDAPATSYVVVIDRAGKVVYTGVGGTQDLDAAIRKAL